MSGHSLVPNAQFDATVHIVLDDFGGRLGRAYRETDEAEADEKTIIENMISGEYSHPVRVVAFNTAEGWSRDATEDIARAVVSRARSEHRALGNAAQNFVEMALGEDAEEIEMVTKSSRLRNRRLGGHRQRHHRSRHRASF
jgi:hypothetical protein